MGGVENFSFHLGHDGHDLVLSNLELAFDMHLSQKHLCKHDGMYKYMGNRNVYSHKTGVLAGMTTPQITGNIIEYLFYPSPQMSCTFPPGPNDDIAWVVVGDSTDEQRVSDALDQALREIQIGIV